MQKEIWRDVAGYEGEYLVSNMGRVLRVSDSRLLTPVKNYAGYYVIGFRHHQYRLARVVASAFIPNPEHLPQINHKDGNKSNNCVDNLRWCTAKENVNNPVTKVRQRSASCDRWKRGDYESNKRKILQFDKTGRFIRGWDSIKDAADFFGKRRATIVSALTNPVKRKSMHGFIWRYADEYNQK